MGKVLKYRSACERRPVTLWRYALVAGFVLIAALTIAGCHSITPIDTKPLDTAGMSYDSIQQLKALKITAPEITEVAKARQSGFSDSDCVGIVTIFRGKNRAFDAGDAVSGLLQAGVSDDTILQLAMLDQLGITSGEWLAMKLAGLSDPIILEVARHRVEGKPVLAGASLARLKNTGVREPVLLELARRGIADSNAQEIVSMRRHGATDAEILNRFPGA